MTEMASNQQVETNDEPRHVLDLGAFVGELTVEDDASSDDVSLEGLEQELQDCKTDDVVAMILSNGTSLRDYTRDVENNLRQIELESIEDVGGEVERIKQAMGAIVDITLDCAGFSKTMSTALAATSSGGKVCLVGMGHIEMTVPLAPAAVREVDVVGIFRYKNTWPLCIEFLQSGKIDVNPLITYRFGFMQKEVEEGFETSARGGNAIKVMFNL